MYINVENRGTPARGYFIHGDCDWYYHTLPRVGSNLYCDVQHRHCFLCLNHTVSHRVTTRVQVGQCSLAILQISYPDRFPDFPILEH